MARSKTTPLVANDGTDWTTPPSPIDGEAKRKADEAQAAKAAKGDGPSGTNEVK